MKNKPKHEPLMFPKNSKGAFFWRLMSPNGKKVCTSGESFSSRAKAVAGFKAAAKLALEAYEQFERSR